MSNKRTDFRAHTPAERKWQLQQSQVSHIEMVQFEPVIHG